MKKSEIIFAINTKITGTTYNLWRIGLTHDIAEHKSYWSETKKQRTSCWTDWQADSLSDAKDIESHFINKGMRGSVGGDLSAEKAVYTYVF